MNQIEIEVNRILIKDLQEKIKRFKKLNGKNGNLRIANLLISKYTSVILNLKKEMGEKYVENF